MGVLVIIFAFATAIGLGVFLNRKATPSLPNSGTMKEGLHSLTDADIIALASDHIDGISVAAVCLASNTTAKDVKNKMEALREQGILYLSVDLNGAEKYILTDTSLISKKDNSKIDKK